MRCDQPDIERIFAAFEHRKLDRDFIEKVISLCMDYYIEIIKMACEEGISWIYIGDEVETDVLEHIEVLGKKGGYILTSSYSITNDVPFENFMSMIYAGHRYGRFPLNRSQPFQKDCFATVRLEEIKKHCAEGKLEQKKFTPATRYGVCSGCEKRKVTFEVPGGEMLCEQCFHEKGWILVHDGPDSGWRQKGEQNSVKIC